MTADLSHSNFVLPSLLEYLFMSSSFAMILLSFWLQSKSKFGINADKCVGTVDVEVSHKSVGESSVAVQDQETSASTCCGSGVPQFLLSLLPPASSEPQPEVNIEEELRCDYVKEFRLQFNEDDVSEEKLVTAIMFLNTLRGGISAHRVMDKLMSAVLHMDYMDSRLDDSGFPMEYSYEELRDIVVEEKGYPFKDFDRVVEKHLETSGFLPSPEEFVDFYHETKVELEREVKETRQEMEETRQEMEDTTQALERYQRVVEETTQEVVQSKQTLQQERLTSQQALQQKDQALQQKDQALQQKDQALQQKDQTIQQKDQTIQQKDRIIEQERQLLQQERQRVWELEQNPEGEFQRRLREMEEEIRRLSARSQRAMCKICLVEEVQVSFTPCNHLVSCQGCAQSLTDDNLPQSQKKCPMCREDIQGTVRMFFA
uniref:Uncharacterized protein LOC111130928 isoform X2 n=1 Tax=Crassostrea virginica TaxID=6565 RepID=A0A8B8E2A3_CRAVI|nr:uncharacterized protein LOC111130928 isoform X2 [Crassostrea virginica]